MDEGAKPSKDADIKGTVTIHIYNNFPCDATFEGDIKGYDISQAWRGMMKSYRLWKHELSKQPINLGGN